MRAKLIYLAALAALAFPADVSAGQCPTDPLKASTALWNWGDIQYGTTKTGVHPCGRKITCSGGKFTPKILRGCRWG